MQELEKILEEIEKEQRSYEADHAWNYARGMEHTADIIRKHMKNEEDVLKFYYCESEDDYYLGQRVQNMYYARYADGCFTWFMSRYLPWGERVTAPETAWKEYTYPTEPKEIPFTEWLYGFIRKHMNDGWIPVDDRLPEPGRIVLITQAYSWENFEEGASVTIGRLSPEKNNKMWEFQYYRPDFRSGTIMDNDIICPGNEYVIDFAICL